VIHVEEYGAKLQSFSIALPCRNAISLSRIVAFAYQLEKTARYMTRTIGAIGVDRILQEELPAAAAQQT
jgi:hypothetical protein